jgi:hypothetical protein
MRASLFILASALIAAPAAAQQPAQPQQQSANEMVLPPELSDPRLADRLVDVMKVLSSALLQLPVGEVEAAIEGRQPSPDEKRRTVRSETGVTERELQRQLEASRPAMRASMQALAKALPAMMRGMAEARSEIERATANIPRPDYPRR